MQNNKAYIYSFDNASFTLIAIEYLRQKYSQYIDSVAVINLIDRWLVKLYFKSYIPDRLLKNILSFLDEMGTVYRPSNNIIRALASLEAGERLVTVMNLYQVVVIIYGEPKIEEIEIFCSQVIDKLGYCPKNLV